MRALPLQGVGYPSHVPFTILLTMIGNTIKTSMLLASLLALAAAAGSHAADGKRYQNQVAKMTCGAATYTLTSACIKSGDPMSLNECKPQTLVIDNAGAKRSAILPELPKEYAARIHASRGGLEDLFVVAWACSNASAGPIATLHYSIGGGSAEYSEAWSYYDKAGNLILNDRKLTLDEVRAVERSLKRVPSIMPE